jgi:hypothetical protein
MTTLSSAPATPEDNVSPLPSQPLPRPGVGSASGSIPPPGALRGHPSHAGSAPAASQPLPRPGITSASGTILSPDAVRGQASQTGSMTSTDMPRQRSVTWNSSLVLGPTSPGSSRNASRTASRVQSRSNMGAAGSTSGVTEVAGAMPAGVTHHIRSASIGFPPQLTPSSSGVAAMQTVIPNTIPAAPSPRRSMHMADLVLAAAAEIEEEETPSPAAARGGAPLLGIPPSLAPLMLAGGSRSGNGYHPRGHRSAESSIVAGRTGSGSLAVRTPSTTGRPSMGAPTAERPASFLQVLAAANRSAGGTEGVSTPVSTPATVGGAAGRDRDSGGTSILGSDRVSLPSPPPHVRSAIDSSVGTDSPAAGQVSPGFQALRGHHARSWAPSTRASMQVSEGVTRRGGALLGWSGVGDSLRQYHLAGAGPSEP